MQQLIWSTLNHTEQREALARPAQLVSAKVVQEVAQILANVQTQGDSALHAFCQRFDNITLQQLRVSQAQIKQAKVAVDEQLKAALAVAYQNISQFHQAQKSQPLRVETMAGVVCEQISRPIEHVGLYIPAGSAPLISSVLMLGIPARLAGCKRVVLCSPPPIANEILYAASLCGIDEIYQVGGAQAIAALAYGTETIAKVDKIFGPGNAYVTEAKRQVSSVTAIDMPAGPSEVMVIADDKANPAFIAADLLSQAEHGADSHAVLVTTCAQQAEKVTIALEQQVQNLPRQAIARASLAASQIIISQDVAQAIEIANQYAPEHLIVQTESPRAILNQIQHAGSIFLGPWSPESVGDYASGTNHVLPTYGFARNHCCLGLADFSKRITVQELSAQGLAALAPSVETLALAEGLQAHQYAVTVRVKAYQQQQASAQCCVNEEN